MTHRILRSRSESPHENNRESVTGPVAEQGASRPHEQLVRWVEWPKDRLKLRVVRRGGDIGRIEAEPPPAASLEPVWILGADQREQTALGCGSLELAQRDRVGAITGAGDSELSPAVLDRQPFEEAGPDIGGCTSAHQDGARAFRKLHADPLLCVRAEMDGEPATARSHFQYPAALDV